MRGAALLLASALAGAAVPMAHAAPPEWQTPKGEQCVEPTQVMRERHWQFLFHHRDETVQRGIRTTRHSLKQCLECHVRPTADGSYPRVTAENHFCGACHTYAAVKLDCFECHADRPAAAYSAAQRTLDHLMGNRP